jgi:hypothetical protein
MLLVTASELTTAEDIEAFARHRACRSAGMSAHQSIPPAGSLKWGLQEPMPKPATFTAAIAAIDARRSR